MKIRLILAVSFCSTRIVGWVQSAKADETVRQLNICAREFADNHGMEDWGSAVFFTKSEEYEAPEPERDGGLLFVAQDSVTDRIKGITKEYNEGQKLAKEYTDSLGSYSEIKGEMYSWIKDRRGFFF